MPLRTRNGDYVFARTSKQLAFEAAAIATQNETSLKLAVCIDRNTAALDDCTLEMRACRERSRS